MSETTVKDGFMFGSWRKGINAARNAKGSIHDTATATKIGMRGGTVAGTVHLDLFAPLVKELFGQRFFERGTLSMFYTFATIDREEVRAVVQVPPKGAKDAQVQARVDRPDGPSGNAGHHLCGQSKGETLPPDRRVEECEAGGSAHSLPDTCR